MLIPHSQLSSEALDDLLTDYVTREGTANADKGLESLKAQLLAKLKSEEVFITYNFEHEQPCLITRDEVSAQALQDFSDAKAAEAQSAEDARDTAEYDSLLASLQSEGIFPFDLGMTKMTREVSTLLESGDVELADLQSMLRRHSNGDFGTATPSSKLLNLKNIKSQGRLLSVYEHAGHTFWVEMLDGHEQAMVMLASGY